MILLTTRRFLSHTCMVLMMFGIGTVHSLTAQESLPNLVKEQVCGFEMTQLYVRDASQTQHFPPGYLVCQTSNDTSILPRCQSQGCACRVLQTYTTKSKQVKTWGLCIEDAEDDTCELPHAPERAYCPGELAEKGQAIPSPLLDVPSAGTKPSNKSSNSEKMTTSELSGQDSQAKSGDNRSSGSSMNIIIAGCGVAAVAAFAMFAVARRKYSAKSLDDELGTPRTGGRNGHGPDGGDDMFDQPQDIIYKHNTTSKSNKYQATSYHGDPNHPLARSSMGSTFDLNTALESGIYQHAIIHGSTGSSSHSNSTSDDEEDHQEEEEEEEEYEEGLSFFMKDSMYEQEEEEEGQEDTMRSPSEIDSEFSSFRSSMGVREHGEEEKEKEKEEEEEEEEEICYTESIASASFDSTIRDTAASDGSMIRDSNESFYLSSQASSTLSFYEEEATSPRKSMEF